MVFSLFLLAVSLCLWIVQSLIVMPLNLLASWHLPLWVSLTLGGILLAWMIGE
jgi:hypothetical protein